MITRLFARLLLVGLITLLPATASATWSVIAVDMATGRIVIASATCVNNNDGFLRGVQAVVVPGKGIAACQAGVDGTHANQMLVYTELQKGTDPARIIEILSKDPSFQSRQFGIVDLTGRMAGHSGLTNGFVTEDIQGRVPGTQIYYSIQGNILRPGEVVPAGVKAFLANTGALTDRVMAGLEAADNAGGDSRCSCPATPGPIPCEGKTAHIAYILMAERTDKAGEGTMWSMIGGRGGQPARDSVFGLARDSTWAHNNGKFSMYLTVTQPTSPGPNAIRPGENLNPVKTLRMRYDEWRKTQPASYK
jgi:hypothetical protein